MLIAAVRHWVCRKGQRGTRLAVPPIRSAERGDKNGTRGAAQGGSV